MTRSSFPFVRTQDPAATDVELTEALRACARRNVSALRRIYDLTAPRLLGELVQLLGDPQLAEAALADCIVQIWQQAGMFSPERSRPGTWLLSIARHHAIDSLREQPATAADEVDAALRLMHAVLEEEAATEEQRLLRLVHGSGRSSAEIARALQWPLQRVKAAIRRGLLALHEEGSALNQQGRPLQQLAGAYALGALSPRVSRRFEALMARDLAPRRAWQQWEERLSTLAPEIPSVRPSENIWPLIDQRLGQSQPRVQSPRRWLLPAALLLGAAVVWILLNRR